MSWRGGGILCAMVQVWCLWINERNDKTVQRFKYFFFPVCIDRASNDRRDMLIFLENQSDVISVEFYSYLRKYKNLI